MLGIVAAVFLAWYGVWTYRPKTPPAALERPRPATSKRKGPGRVSSEGRASGAGAVEEMGAKHAHAEGDAEAREPVTEAWIDHALPEIDLPSLASRRLRIVGVANYLHDLERSLFDGVEYASCVNPRMSTTRIRSPCTGKSGRSVTSARRGKGCEPGTASRQAGRGCLRRERVWCHRSEHAPLVRLATGA